MRDFQLLNITIQEENVWSYKHTLIHHGMYHECCNHMTSHDATVNEQQGQNFRNS